jgi:hypothetical protein
MTKPNGRGRGWRRQRFVVEKDTYGFWFIHDRSEEMVHFAYASNREDMRKLARKLNRIYTRRIISDPSNRRQDSL